MARPTLFYIRHGETNWNVEARLQGRRDIALNATGRVQATRCGDILADLFAREARAPTAFDYVASPLVRARATMELVRTALGLDPVGYVVEPQLVEISFGRWEGFTLAELQGSDANLVTSREHDKWNFLPPGGESYRMLAVRVGSWYRRLARDTVVAAHGGTLRALIADLGLVSTGAAPSYNVAQGAVYVITADAISRYA